MTPTFNNKDLILTTKFFFKLKINDVVLVDTSEFGIALKRIQSLDGDEIKLNGDNDDYESPIYKKTFNKQNIIGKVFYKFKSF